MKTKSKDSKYRKNLHGDPNTVYTDAEMYKNSRDALAAVIDSDHNVIDCLTIKNTNPEEAEAGAIWFRPRRETTEEPVHNHGLQASMLRLR